MSVVQTISQRIITTRSNHEEIFLVALCGWADTGKSTIAAALCQSLIDDENVNADCVSTDAFLKCRDDRNRLGISGYHPAAIDKPALESAVERLSSGRKITYYPYDNRTGRRVAAPRDIEPKSVIVLEGIHALHPAILRRVHLRIFIDSDENTLKAMRCRANMVKRGMDESAAVRHIDAELEEYKKYVLPGKAAAHLHFGVDCHFDYWLREVSDGT